MKYKFLLFDLDDTLFDFKKSEKKALEYVFAEIGLAYTPETLATYWDINHKLWQAYEQGCISSKEVVQTRFTKLIEVYQLSYDGIVAEQLFRNKLAEANYLLPHAREILRTVSQTHRLFAVTNGIAETQYQRLETTRIGSFFEKIYISELMGVKKPDREYFDYVFSHSSQLKKEEGLMIGDNLATDIIGGQHYGIDTCWINHKKTKQLPSSVSPTYEITHLRQLYSIV